MYVNDTGSYFQDQLNKLNDYLLINTYIFTVYKNKTPFWYVIVFLDLIA